MSYRTDRQSNFELLRIITMFMIVMGHMSWQAFDYGQVNAGGVLFMYVFCRGARIGVNLFLMIGLWFLVDSKFKAGRILKLYGALWFYSVPLTLLLVAIGVQVSRMELVSCFFPFMRRRMWFVPLYITLLLVAPFLKFFVDKMSREIHRFSVILGFFLISFICSTTVMMDKYLASFMWFMYMYFVISYYKKYVYGSINRKWAFLVMGLSIYFIMAITVYFCERSNAVYMGYIGKILSQYLVDYKSIPNFVCSICIFIFFTKLDIGVNKIVNCVAAYTMDVYMIHQSDAFYNYLWTGICRSHSWQDSDYFVPIFIVVSVTVFIGCSIIGALRVRFVEPIWLKSRLFVFLEEKIDRIYKELNL